MALAKKKLGEKPSNGSAQQINLNSTNSGNNTHPSASNGQNGDNPFTEEDVKEVFEDRLDFFENELNLDHDKAVAQAVRSTNAWQREVFGDSRK